MTFHAQISPRALGDRTFVLATDLDGTFLGGSEADRARLYDWIEANRRSIGLVFVTGRDPDFITELCSGPVPTPDYVIGDVGTTIAHVGEGARIEPIADLEAEIAERWAHGGPRVRDALADHPALSEQPTAFRYRVSYDYDPAHSVDDAVALIDALGYDALISDNRFLDVLPRGVSKGPSLRRLVDWLGLDGARVLAAGDTLNDLSMLTSGLPAVAVGGSEAALIERVADHATVYRAAAIGAAGILEAVAALDLHPVPEGA